VGVQPGETLRISLAIFTGNGARREKVNFAHSECGPALRLTFCAVWVYLCPQTSVSVPAQAGVLDLLCFGCVCVCCVSVGRDCPFFCPGVT